MYVLFPAAWLLPDNAAWWALLSLLLVLLNPQPATWTRAFLASSLLVVLVISRQVHAWAAVPMVLAWWLAWPASRDEPVGAAAGLAPPTGERGPAFLRALLACALCIPAILIMLAFARLWHGLIPPAFQPGGSPLTTHEYTRVGGVSPATPALILALLGVFGVFFAGFLAPSLKQKCWGQAALVGAMLALPIALLPRTDYSYSAANPDMSRFSGLWNLVKALSPLTPGWRTSPVILLPAMLGGVWLALWLRALPRKQGWVLAAALLAFTAAHTAGALSWQRYFEPFVLIWLIVSAALLWRPPTPRSALLGPLALAVLQATNTALSLLRG
jgi:hypothetical protein